MKIFINFTIACMLAILTGCNSISSDPIKGAEELTQLLIHSEESANIKETHELLSRYWDAYVDNNRTKFLIALHHNLVGEDKLVKYIVSQDFHSYPMCGTYMENILKIQHNLAMKEPSSNWASKGILFGSILADYADSGEEQKASDLIIRTYENLKNAPLLNQIEFFYTFQQFINTSGLQGQKAFNLLNELNFSELTEFKLLAVESVIDFS